MHKYDLQSMYLSPYLQSETKSKPWADQEGGGGVGGPDPHLKSQNIELILQYWSGSPEKLQSNQASIQCWAVICPQRNAILMAFRWRADDGPFKAVFGSSIP